MQASTEQSVSTSANKPYIRPTPRLTGLTAQFYGWLHQGELRFQRCSGCGLWRHIPRDLCPDCHGDQWTWERSSGRGKVFSWSTMYRPLHEAFADQVPIAAVIVELEEGPRMISSVEGISPDQLEFDMPVRVVFDKVRDDLTFARFTPA